MANTLTNLIPDVYAGLDVVSRELVGLIPAVSTDMTVERAAKDQTVRSPVAPAATASDVTPNVTPPDDGDQTFSNVSLSISKVRRVPVRWNGEQSRGVDTGPGRRNLMRDQFAQAMRTLVNEVETDLSSLYAKASRAYGTAGTTPFGTAGDFTDASNVLKILKDNGSPLQDNQLVIDTTAGANFLGKQGRVDYSGDDSIQRQGIILPLHGMDVRESAQIKTPAAGTSSGHLVNDASLSEGDTVIAVDTGTGTILAGDVVTFAGDSNKYVVTSALSGGSFTIAAPGLKQDIADNAAVTVVGAAARNMAFNRSAIVLATRAPALPEEGDSAVDRQIVQDPRSGLAFEVSMYMQYRQVQYEIALAWGYEMVKPSHAALLLG